MKINLKDYFFATLENPAPITEAQVQGDMMGLYWEM